MMNFVRSLLDSDSLSPHGICLLWRPELIWTHVIADALIAGAYLSIPIGLGYLVAKRGDIAYGWIFWGFVVFILACGTTHILSIVTLWLPIYGLEAVAKVLTALASVGTAIGLWVLMPALLGLPSHERLRVANDALTDGIGERDRALHALERANRERVDAEDRLRQSQKMEAIGQLTGGIAHDFNNLLSVVIANLERVQRLLPSEAALQRRIADAMTGADRAAALTQKLLAFARKQPLRPVDVDVSALLEDLAGLLQGALQGRVALKMVLARDLWPVKVDPNELETVVLNLAVNARDAMADSPASVLTVTTRNVAAPESAAIPGIESARDHILLEVADTGAGMSPEVISRAFEPFFTTKPVGQGTGLGLSQVFGFIKQSGGHAAIDSEPGVGTWVRVFLPRAQPAAAVMAEIEFVEGVVAT